VIPHDYITEWRRSAPWVLDSQVEQDLVISRALVELFRQQEIRDRTAFRGGTALYKLNVPPARYSEDIDLVPVTSGPIGPLISAARAALDGWLGQPRRDFKEGRVVLQYRIHSQDSPPLPLRLKVEINSCEHFCVLGFQHRPYAIASRWFSGSADITTYALDELLGTKLRALYQRRKGRDLFDLWTAAQAVRFDPASVVRCFAEYVARDGLSISRAEFEANLHEKLANPGFRSDVEPLLTQGRGWDCDAAAEFVLSELVARLPGPPWMGTNDKTGTASGHDREQP